MQDWERTQELAAEAQNSAGASAAQYAVYAESMEAALTNLKTSWQEFIQSITSSKFLISTVKFITKSLTVFTNLLEKFPGLVKSLTIAIGSISLVMNTINKVKSALGMETKTENILLLQQKQLLLERLKIEAQIAKAKVESVRATEKEQQEELKALEEKKNKQQEILNQAKKQKEELEKFKKEQQRIEKDIKTRKGAPKNLQKMYEAEVENGNVDDSYKMSYGDRNPSSFPDFKELEKTNKEIKQKIAELEANMNEGEVNAASEAIRKLESEQEIVKGKLLDTTKELNKEIATEKTLQEQVKVAQEGVADAALNANNSMYRRNETMKQQLELQKAKLEIELKSVKTEQEKEKIKKRIEKVDTRILKINKKQEKLQQGAKNLISNIGNTITNTILSGLQGIFSKLGPFSEILNSGLNSLVNWGSNLLEELAIEKLITKEKNKQSVLDGEKSAVKGTNVTLTGAEKVVENKVTEEKQEQLAAENAENASKIEGIGLTGTEIASETTEGAIKDANNAKEKVGLMTKIKSALAKAAESAASIPIGGWLIALSLLAAAGIAVAVNSNRKNSTAYKESSIQKNNNTIYSRKKENSELKSNLSELQELNRKSIRTKEENERLEELTASIQDLDESFAGLTGNSLTNAVMRKINDNTVQISNLIDKNLKLAYNINNLNNSTIGQQAISNSLIASQEKLIESNDKLWKLNNEELNKKVSSSSATMAEDLSQSFNYDDYLKTDKFTFSDGLKITGSALLTGAMAGMTMGGPIGALAGAIGAGISGLTYSLVNSAENKKQREKEQAELQSSLRYYNTVIIDAATTMETELSKSTTSLTSQIKVYDEIVKSFGDNALLKEVLGNQYATTDFLYSLTVGHKQVLDNIDSLVKLNAITEEGISKLASVVADIDQQDEKANSILHLFDKVYNGNDKTARQILDELNNGIEKNADGTLKKDKQGNYVSNMPILTNEALTNDINNLNKIIESGYGSYTKKQIQEEIEFYKNFNSKDIFENFINGMKGALIDNNGNYITDPEEQVKAIRESYKDNSTALRKYLNDQETKSNNLKYEASQARLYGKFEKASALMKEANEIDERIKKTRTEFENTYKEILGDLTDTELSSLVQGLDSSIDKAQGLKNKVKEGTLLEIEDFEFLRNTVIPSLQKAAEDIGKSFDAEQFMKDFQQGNLNALEKMNDFVDTYSNDSIEKLTRNSANKLANMQEAYRAIEEVTTEEEKKTAEANYNLAASSYAVAKAMEEQAKNKLKIDKADLVVQEKLNRLQKQLETLENEEDLLRTYKQQLVILKQIAEENKKKYENEIKQSAQSLGITEEQLRNYMNMRKARNYDAKQVEFVNKLSADGLEILNNVVEKVEEIGDTYEENIKSIQEKTNSWYETQVDYQDQIVEALKSKLKEEQDAVQNSLDKRREMYDKYFESLQEEEDDASFEDEQARLQKAIVSLSGATDATSLSKLKEYQQELNDLEKEQRQTERDRRKDALDTYLDNQEEKMNQYYEDRLNNEEELWRTISSMTESGIADLMKTYSEDYKNATELNKMYMLQSYKELHMNLMGMMGNTDGYSKARQDYENYRKYLAAYANNSSIGKYDSSKAYSTGGLVDYTGLAMVHGSYAKPEAFLNAEQTAMFASLASGLQTYYSRLGYNNNTESQTSGITIENFTVAVDATLTNDNVAQTGESLADALLDGLRRTGISVNMKR